MVISEQSCGRTNQLTGARPAAADRRVSACSGSGGRLLAPFAGQQGIRWWRGCEMNSEKLERELGADRLLIVHFDLEAQVLDHAPDLGGWLARCREVAVHKDGVGWIEGERLETA